MVVHQCVGAWAGAGGDACSVTQVHTADAVLDNNGIELLLQADDDDGDGNGDSDGDDDGWWR